MLEKRVSLEELAENLNHRRVRRPRGSAKGGRLLGMERSRFLVRGLHMELQRFGFAARVRGAEPDAPALLFLHGLGGDWTFWDEAFAWPGLEPYSLVAVDLPGFGAAPPLRPFTFDEVVDRLGQLVEALAVPVVAVGHSMGGTVTALLAERAPLGGVLLVEANLLPLGPEVSASAAGALARSEGRFEAWFDDFARWVEEHAAGDAGASRYVHSFSRVDRATFGEACSALVAATTGGVGPRYAALDVPRVYIVGGDEEPTHVAFVRDRGLELERVADAGHSVMVDQPTAFYGFLESWVESALRDKRT